MIFANIMQDKGGGKKYWNKLFHKYRFVILNDSSFEEKLSVKLSRLNMFAFLGVFIFGCFFGTLLLFIYTPLNEYVPGKSSKEIQKTLIQLSLKSDSLQNSIENRALYLENINNIISGKDFVFVENSIITSSVKNRKTYGALRVTQRT